ncbi:MAG: hypothetical protein ACKV0T_23390 [Planctomycetales bacterium]
MTSGSPSPHPTDKPPRSNRPLERLTAGVLLAFIAALGWMILVAYFPGVLRLASLELEVILMLALLVAALSLVSLVALWHTRS